MKFLKFILPLLALSAFGAERITLTITVTNPPVTSNTLTINADTRIWTNNSAAGYIATNLTSVNASATNLYNQIASFPYSGPLFQQWAGTNSIRLISTVGGALAGSSVGTWATLTLSTQTGPQTYTALWPLENMVGPTNRTNEASSLVYGLGIYSTNAFPTNATATSNLLHKGAGPEQVINTQVRFTNSIRVGGGITATNGYWTNAVLGNPKTTNLINYGNAISSPNTNGMSGENFGNAASATGINSLAVGVDANATGVQSTAIGQGTRATNASATAIGTGAAATTSATALGELSSATGENSVALGKSSSATGTNSIAIGTSTSATHSNSIVLGNFGTSSASDQIVVGSSSHTVSIPGVLAVSGTQTNTVFTGTNKFDLAISKSVTNITTLANGVNLVDPGFKSYIVVSGPSAAYSLDKLTRGYDGREIEFEKQDSFTMTINDESGSAGGSATDRIRTGTGGAVTLTNNPGSFLLRYNASLGRWVLKWKTN